MKRINSASRWNSAKRTVILTLVVMVLACAFCACDIVGSKDTDTTLRESIVSTESVKPAEEPTEETVPTETSSGTESYQSTTSEETVVEKKLSLTINGQNVSVQWEDNESVKALKDFVKNNPLKIQMSMYGGFEQVGSLGTNLPRNDRQTKTSAGDIVLYSGNQIVVFYGSNSWAYTRLGYVTDKNAAEMTELLGNGNVTIEILMK
ncbi:MAG: hypothetical protein J5762_07945 [Clostridia bacterium]|nr:hypothetical protein [Clostridia bacterium]